MCDIILMSHQIYILLTYAMIVLFRVLGSIACIVSERKNVHHR